MGEITRGLLFCISIAITNGAPYFLGFPSPISPGTYRMPYICGNPYYQDLRQAFFCNHYIGLQNSQRFNSGYQFAPGVNGLLPLNQYTARENIPLNGLDFFKGSENEYEDHQTSYETSEGPDTLINVKDKIPYEGIPEDSSSNDKNKQTPIINIILPVNIDAAKELVRMLLSFKKDDAQEMPFDQDPLKIPLNSENQRYKDKETPLLVDTKDKVFEYDTSNSILNIASSSEHNYNNIKSQDRVNDTNSLQISDQDLPKTNKKA